MTKRQNIKIEERAIGIGHPCYIIAEISCNHDGDIEEARRLIKAAAEGGADAVKLQTYTADTMTRDFDRKAEKTIWSEINLHKLYEKAYTPWEWSFELKELSEELGIQLLSTPFDETAVDFLVDELKVPALKVASFEVVDVKLLEKMAKTKLPIIMSNGMTDFLELYEAVRTLYDHGCEDLALLHCNSGYPAAFAEANLKTMQAMEEIFDTPVGVSDHTLFADHQNYERPMAHITPVEAVRLGAKIIEVHLMMDRAKGRKLFEKGEAGFDWPFSMEPEEFKLMVSMIRKYEEEGKIEYASEEEHNIAAITHGNISFEPTEKELNSRNVRPSLWVVKDINEGDSFSFAAENKGSGNFDSIRPAGGIHVRFADLVEGKTAKNSIRAGSPLCWEDVNI